MKILTFSWILVDHKVLDFECTVILVHGKHSLTMYAGWVRSFQTKNHYQFLTYLCSLLCFRQCLCESSFLCDWSEGPSHIPSEPVPTGWCWRLRGSLQSPSIALLLVVVATYNPLISQLSCAVISPFHVAPIFSVISHKSLWLGVYGAIINYIEVHLPALEKRMKLHFNTMARA